MAYRALAKIDRGLEADGFLQDGRHVPEIDYAVVVHVGGAQRAVVRRVVTPSVSLRVLREAAMRTASLARSEVAVLPILFCLFAYACNRSYARLNEKAPKGYSKQIHTGAQKVFNKPSPNGRSGRDTEKVESLEREYYRLGAYARKLYARKLYGRKQDQAAEDMAYSMSIDYPTALMFMCMIMDKEANPVKEAERLCEKCMNLPKEQQEIALKYFVAGFSYSPEDAAMKKLAFLVGRWEGEATIEYAPGIVEEVRQIEEVQPKFDGRVLLIEDTGYVKQGKESGETPRYKKAMTVVSYDESAKRYRWHVYGYRDSFIEAKARVDDKAFTWQYAAPDYVGRKVSYRYTMHLMPSGEWFQIGEQSEDGKAWTKFVEMNLRK